MRGSILCVRVNVKKLTAKLILMTNLPKITDLDVAGKRVLVRADLDVVGGEDYRLEALGPTLDFLSGKDAKIVVIGHRGRPEGKFDSSLSTKEFQPFFDKWGARVEENLRFDPGEGANDFDYAKKLASLGDVYVNEAFATSHRNAASITSLPKLLPHAAGFRFVKEVENLSRVLENPQQPVVFIIGGAKKDKLDYLEDIKKIADKVLIGGRLPEYIPEYIEKIANDKLLVANLLPDKEDLTMNTILKFGEEIEKAGTVVLAGPMGKFEEEGHRQGTERIFKAVVNSRAFKVAGGGDTESAISLLGLRDQFDWVSVGGGAMLQFLAKGTLPGIEALLH